MNTLRRQSALLGSSLLVAVMGTGCRPSVPSGADASANTPLAPAPESATTPAVPPWEPISDAVAQAAASTLVQRAMVETSPAPDVLMASVLGLARAHAEEDALAACERGDGAACQRAGALAMDGTASGVERMLDLFALGCLQGHDASCDFATAALSRMQSVDWVGERLAPACARGRAVACAAIAWSEIDWMASPPTIRPTALAPDAVVPALEAGCAHPHLPSCVYLGAWHLGTGDAARALAVFSAACEAGAGLACAGIAQVRLAEPDPEAPADTGTRLVAACAAGASAACFQAAVLDLPPVGQPLTDVHTSQLRQACAAGIAMSCQVLAERLLRADPTGPGLEAAVPWLVTGCNLGAGDACYVLAAELRDGLENAEQNEMVRELTRRACAEGVQAACSLQSAAPAPPALDATP